MPRLETTDPWVLAQRRVARGVEFLAKHAPLDWERRMFHIDGSDAHIRALCNLDTECHLALAFCINPSVARWDGRVTRESVALAYGLSPGKLLALGFDISEHQYEDSKRLYRVMLDEAWVVALTTYAKPEPAPPVHYMRPAPATHSAPLFEHPV